jgi:hypothetical protein
MPEINQLSAATTVSPGDQIPIYSAANGDTRKAAVSVLSTSIQQTIMTALADDLDSAANIGIDASEANLDSQNVEAAIVELAQRSGIYSADASKIVDFMAQRFYDQRGNALLNGVRRSIQYRRTTGLTYDDNIDVNDGDGGGDTLPTGHANTTAAGLTLEFLSRYVIKYPAVAGDVVPMLREVARFILVMQIQQPNTARYGGFGLAINDQTASSFNAGVCGRALIQAWYATGDPNYLKACVRAATFLSVCHSPNATYSTLYSETPIPADALNTPFKGFCDTIGTTDVISITSSTWNLVAADFLKQLYAITGTASYLTIANDARDWMAFGVLNGYDYWAVKNAAPSAHVSVSWPNSSSHTFADGAWHRLGDVALTGTVGTDQIEYGLDALLSLGYDTAALLTAYQYFRDLPNYDTGDFGNGYSGAICFTGFWKLAPYGENKAFGTYYDVQGAGTLLYFKQQLAPADMTRSLQLILLAVDRGSLVNQVFQTIYSNGTGFTYYTKGTIPIAKAGIGLLRCF